MLLLGGCDRLQALVSGEDDADDEPKTKAKPVINVDPKVEPKPKPQKPAELMPLVRAKRKLPLPARGTNHLGFNLDNLDALHAVAGALEIPDWAAVTTDDVAKMRDDDLGTAWECPLDPYKPCAIGVHLTTSAKVRALRIFGAAPGKAYEQHPRPAKVRVHTETGWMEADLLDGPDYAYVTFGKPVETTTLVVEFLGTHGNKKGSLFIADIELFGHEGTPRDPIELDPSRVVVALEGKPWTKGRDGQMLAASFLEVLADDGTPRRIMPGTAIYGRAEDDILLVEALANTDCKTHTGLFYLFNRKTRVPVPVGDLGGMGGMVFRSKDGLGFVAGYVDDVEARVTGVVLEGASYKHRRSQRLAEVEGPASLDAWGIEREPSIRGGSPLNRPLEGCTLGTDDSLTLLRSASKGKAEAKPGEWLVCDVGGGAKAYLTDHGPCGKSWEITILDGANKLVGTKAARRSGAHMRVRRGGKQQMLVEVGGDDDTTELFRVSDAGLVSLGARALSIAAPDACRDKCDDKLINNSIP